MLLATVLTLAIQAEVDLGPLVRHYEAVCGIKVVGYHMAGQPGQTFRYGRETFVIPREGFVELIALRRVKHYVIDGRKLPLEDGVSPLDAFSFRWINLPASPAQGENP